ncbi:MAG: ATP-binding protein [Tenericutes bacterium]|nr:ATP-binding protein [Mycoplasmatota bacterium]
MSYYEEQLKISGQILKEVSEKLPNMYIALNELLKNAYDACAKKVEIIYSSESNSLIIRDDGEGMDKKGITTLLSVSKSSKKYGHKNKCGRITQGSKGLGFLSVFKFGEEAYWESVNNNVKRLFSMNIREIELQDNASDKRFKIEEENVNNVKNYTFIRIAMTEKTEKEFLRTFENQENSEKILNSFSDKSMSINLNINNEIISSTNEVNTYNEEFSDKIIYTVKYDSKIGKIIFSQNSIELFESEFIKESNKFEIDLCLTIYDLKGTSVEEADPLFIFRTSNDRFIAPLVYINNNLFQSHELFNPSITRSIRSAIVLPQIAGYINIYSTNSELEFNAERTKLVDNSFSNELIHFLQRINIEIQTKGSENKFGLVKKDKIIKNYPEGMPSLPGDSYEDNITAIKSFCINPSFKHSSLISTSINNKKITFKFMKHNLGTYTLPKLKKDETFPVRIKLIKSFDIMAIPSQQIDLMTYVEDARNSKLENIKDEIKVLINGVNSSNKILRGIDSKQEVEIVFSYNDPITGPHNEPLKIRFDKSEEPLVAETGENYLLPLYTRPDYKITYDYFVSKLINQINMLYQNDSIKKDDKREVLACSLRTIFDLSIQVLIRNSILPNEDKYSKNLEVAVNKVINLINDKDIRESIANNTSISIEALKNKLLISSGTKPTAAFGDAVRKSNLATHSSTMHISESDIEDLGKHIAFFVVIVNEILINDFVNEKLSN